MKIAPLILALSLLLTACSQRPSDAETRQKIPGLWTPDFNADFTWKIEPDGRFFKLFKDGATNGWTADGNWGLTNGILTFAVTNRDWSNYPIAPESYRLVRIDDQEMLFVSGDKDGKAIKKPTSNTTNH